MRPSPIITVTVLLLLASGCELRRDDGGNGGSSAGRRATAAPDTAPASTASTASTLATRSEAQAELDDARAALAKGDRVAFARDLRYASAFFRTHVGEPTSAARRQLDETATQLDSLADLVQRGGTLAGATLDTAIARAQLADAEHHRSMAAVAWARHENQRAGAELTMAMDHLERAAQDAHIEITATTRQALNDARSAAAGLATAKGAVPREMDRWLGTIGQEIARLDARLRDGPRRA